LQLTEKTETTGGNGNDGIQEGVPLESTIRGSDTALHGGVARERLFSVLLDTHFQSRVIGAGCVDVWPPVYEVKDTILYSRKLNVESEM
jgi:hypothetical protein